MQEAEVRDRIRTMIRTGELPCDETGTAWAGKGEGKLCAACMEPIPPTEIEFEVVLPSGTPIRLHRLCQIIWWEECEPSAPAI